MNPADWQKVKEIFNAAVEIAPERRGDFLAQRCAGNTHLRPEVDALLRSDNSTFFERAVILTEEAEPTGLPTGSFLDRFEILKLIGVGGMGKVYLASDGKLGRKVAIKVINEKYEGLDDSLRRFIQEAKAASALNHPNILTIYEIGEAEGANFIVSEYIEGSTLREVLREGRLKLLEAIDVSLQIAAALAAAHAARILHRDIKPENIIVRRDGYVKVLDFGLAKLLPESNSLSGLEDETREQNHTAKGLILGTIKYMSPEQAKGIAVDYRTDIFSLGVLIYETVTGKAPFAGETSSETLANLINKKPEPLARIVAGVPEELQRIISKMLQKTPHDRYHAMERVLEDLRDLKDSLTIGRESKHPLPLGDSTGEILNPDTGRGLGRQTEKAGSRELQRIIRSMPVAVAAIALVFFGAAVIFGWSYYYRVAPAKVFEGYAASPAYDYYLRGRVNASSENRENNERSIELLEQAVAVDPNFAPAYAELARSYNVKAFYLASAAERGRLIEDAQVAVEKALSLNTDLAEAHFARGLIMWSHGNRFPHDQVIRSYQRALSLNPNLDEAHHQLGLVYLHIGLFDKAAEHVESAVAINPSNTMARYRLGVIAMYRGNYMGALEIYSSTPLDKNPSLWAFQQATALFHLGRNKEASDIVDEYLRSYSTDPGGTVTSVKAILLAKEGKTGETEKAIMRAVEVGSGFGHFHHTAFNIASAYAIMARPADAVKWLRNAADDGLPCYPLILNDTTFNNVRNTGEFIQFMDEMRSLNEKYRNEFR